MGRQRWKDVRKPFTLLEKKEYNLPSKLDVLFSIVKIVGLYITYTKSEFHKNY